jgi:hypothetical protein
MQTTKRLTNLQLELLKVFSFDISDNQLIEIKSMLTQYFAQKVTNDLDVLFEQKGWGIEKIEEWSEEHMRTNHK